MTASGGHVEYGPGPSGGFALHAAMPGRAGAPRVRSVLEDALRTRGRSWENASFEELDAMWEEVKRAGVSPD